VTIGGTTAGAGTFTTLTASTSITGTLATAAQPNITSVGSLTSLDVGGTVTADGLTVDGTGTFNNNVGVVVSGATPTIRITETDTTDENTQFIQASGTFRIRTASDDYSTTTERLRIDHGTGDISFYEDTGTTAKFFWDASAESLGIGTSTFDNAAQVVVAKGDASVSASDADNSGFNFTAVPDTTTGKVGIGFKTFNETASAVAALYATPINQYRNSLTARYNADGSGAGYFSVEQLIPASGTVAERMRIDSSGNVGIGTTSPSRQLSVVNSATASLLLQGADATGYSQVLFGDVSSETAGYIQYYHGDNAMRFATNGGNERMRIDSSGNVLVGRTDLGFDAEAIVLRERGEAYITSDGRAPLLVNRLTSDGDIVSFRKDGTTVGSIGTSVADLWLGTGISGLYFYDSASSVIPWDAGSNTTSDNVLDLGSSAYRWDDIYATNGTIQTSDQNEKQDIAELSDAEQRVAVAAKGLLRKFRWRDAVEEKGDEARTHFGIIAQDLQAAFEAEGLDAGDYAMFIHTTWTDEETGEERSRMGVRYSELLAFIIAAI
jgi:hypothetical protein